MNARNATFLTVKRWQWKMLYDVKLAMPIYSTVQYVGHRAGNYSTNDVVYVGCRAGNAIFCTVQNKILYSEELAMLNFAPCKADNAKFCTV